MSAVIKCQQFKNSVSDKTKSSVSNRQQLDIYNNKKEQDFNIYESESKNKTYFFFLSCYSSSSSKRIKPPNIFK